MKIIVHNKCQGRNEGKIDRKNIINIKKRMK